MTFPSTHPALARALAAREYTTPTDVQLAVLAEGAVGRDLLVSAQTGSGKTVAFGLALAETLLGTAEKFERAAAPLALVVAPTRELAMQVHRELVWLYAEAGAQIISCVGGMDPKAEARLLFMGAHIVVGTPGRLRDHLERKRLDLSQLKAIVLDEADEMLDLGFREDLEFILDATPATRRSLMFSATMPRDIEALAKRFQRDAVRIETTRRDQQHADIEYSAVRVAPRDVENAVVNVLRFHEAASTLVFCTTREAVKRLHARLLERGFSAVALSGELTQTERTHALQALRDGHARVLVATDVAARGLDVADLSLVIHAELPNDRETLLHRSGRTGRAGKKGNCILIVPYNRRRKAEVLIGAARLRVSWGVAPTPEAIRARDQERFLADPSFADAPTEAEQAAVATLQASRSAQSIALALIRLHHTRLPEPEDLVEDTGPPARERRPRDDSFDRAPRSDGASEHAREAPRERKPRPPRDTREMVWFRLNIGRDRNADPRWILPLVCKAGGVTKSEIGSIKIYDTETRFQIVAENADQFADAARTAKNKEGHITRIGSRTDADDAAVTAAIDGIAKPPVEMAPIAAPPATAAEAVVASPGATEPAAAVSATGASDRPAEHTERPAHKEFTPRSEFKPRTERVDQGKRPARTEFKDRSVARTDARPERADFKPRPHREKFEHKPTADRADHPADAKPVDGSARPERPQRTEFKPRPERGQFKPRPHGEKFTGRTERPASTERVAHGKRPDGPERTESNDAPYQARHERKPFAARNTHEGKPSLARQHDGGARKFENSAGADKETKFRPNGKPVPGKAFNKKFHKKKAGAQA